MRSLLTHLVLGLVLAGGSSSWVASANNAIARPLYIPGKLTCTSTAPKIELKNIKTSQPAATGPRQRLFSVSCSATCEHTGPQHKLALYSCKAGYEMDPNHLVSCPPLNSGTDTKPVDANAQGMNPDQARSQCMMKLMSACPPTIAMDQFQTFGIQCVHSASQ